jgi:hypothetical protein
MIDQVPEGAMLFMALTAAASFIGGIFLGWLVTRW